VADPFLECVRRNATLAKKVVQYLYFPVLVLVHENFFNQYSSKKILFFIATGLYQNLSLDRSIS